MSLQHSVLREHIIKQISKKLKIDDILVTLDNEDATIHILGAGFISDHGRSENYNVLNDFYLTGDPVNDLPTKLTVLLKLADYCVKKFDCDRPKWYSMAKSVASYKDGNDDEKNEADGPYLITEKQEDINIDLVEANAKIEVYKEIISGSSITIQK